MSRKMLITLIVVMVFVLSGLIIVQTKMIKTASDIREEQFNTLIKNALANVSYRLNQDEEREARNSALQNRLSNASSAIGNIFPRNDGGVSSIQYGLSYSDDGVVSYYQDEFQLNFQDTTNLNNTDSIINDLAGIDGLLKFGREQDKWREQQYLTNLNWATYKMLLEERPIKERIDSAFLKNVLAITMAETGIGLDYKYAVKNSNLGKDRIIFGDANYKPGRKKEYSQLLFPNDFNSKPNYLYLYFPKRSGYLFRETGTTIIPTIILTALLIGIFVYTILIIFRQKKLSNIKE